MASLGGMVRDYLESSGPTKPPRSSKPKSSLALQELLDQQTDDELEIRNRIVTYMKNMKSIEDQPNKEVQNLMLMKLKMDGYDASICKTSSDFTFDYHKGCPKLSSSSRFTSNYEYIDVMIAKNKTRVVVDLQFRSEFEVAKSTDEYKEILNIIPLILVASEEKLLKIISLVCSAMKKSMKKMDLHMSPVRKLDYMQSKWLPKHSKGVSVVDENSTCCPSFFGIGKK